MHRHRLGFVVSALLTLAACTTSTPEIGQPTPNPTAATSSSPSVSGDRLLVLRADGNLVTMSPTGADMIALTTDAGPGRIESQAVGSPNGRSIAWVEFDEAGASVETASRFGEHHVSQPLAFPPFYLLWDPTSTRVLYLGNAGSTIGLGVVDAAVVQPKDIPVGGGAPLYLSWNPDGTQIVVHVGANTLGTSDLSSPLHTIPHTPGTFQAPVWLPDGGLVYVIRERAKQSIVVDRDGTLDTLATFPSGGGTVFTADPSGRRIAYRIDRPDGTQTGVFVQSIKGGPVQTVTTYETTDFVWSPDGSKLLLMQPVAGAADPTTHRWAVWDGAHVRTVSPAFVPSDTFFNQYAPFFDQYAQSQTPWAPSSDAFAFAGTVQGQRGVWVARLDGSAPAYVDSGVMVSWLPADQAS